MPDTLSATVISITGYSVLIACAFRVLAPPAFKWLVEGIEQAAILLVDLWERAEALASVHRRKTLPLICPDCGHQHPQPELMVTGARSDLS